MNQYSFRYETSTYKKQQIKRIVYFIYKSVLDISPPEEIWNQDVRILLQYSSLKTSIKNCNIIIKKLIKLPKFQEIWNLNSEENNISLFINHLYKIILSREPDSIGFKITFKHIQSNNIINRIKDMIYARIFRLNNEGYHDKEAILASRNAAIVSFQASFYANKYVHFTNKYIEIYKNRYSAWKQTIIAAKHAK